MYLFKKILISEILCPSIELLSFLNNLSMRGKRMLGIIILSHTHPNILSWKANCRTLFNYMHALCANSERETLLSYFSHFSMGKIPCRGFFLRRWILLIIITKKQTCIQTCNDDEEKGQRWNFSLWAFSSLSNREMRGIFL